MSDAIGSTEYQWGVRTVYTDGSQGIDWTNEDDARSYLMHYADYDGAPHMRVRARELVRRPILPSAVETVKSDYAELRAHADKRRR